MEKHIKAPISKEVSRKLRAGDYVYITGTIYTARDAAHKRMDDALKNGENLPVDMVGQTIYYMGPSPAREGRPIGSAGPTTKRSKEVLDAVKRNGSVYFAAVGGAGALLSKCIKTSEVVAYDDLGTEAIRKLYVEDFPVIVVADCEGGYLYESAIKEYKKI